MQPVFAWVVVSSAAGTTAPFPRSVSLMSLEAEVGQNGDADDPHHPRRAPGPGPRRQVDRDPHGLAEPRVEARSVCAPSAISSGPSGVRPASIVR